MTDFTIIEAKPYHCGQMSRLLRAEHREAIARVGADIHREMRARFDASSFRRAWMIDGRLAALGGVVGTSLSTYGFVWLALTNEARRYPLAVVREARRQLDEIMTVRRELATTIIGGDEAAKRLAVFLGFHVSESGPGSRAYSRFARRDLARHLENDPELRLPIGNGYAVALGYHHKEAA